ncbi:MAG: ShlB/FhaC/HecB family hemolysin secretion/activation protein [Thiobacillus sp.]|nr:ShlB/FhaC/HecB family hemolysin secretion/activation protein [Thiobacillus sp.]
MQKFKLAPLALLVLSYSVFAQQIPSAGSQLQQIPPTPAPEQPAPKLSIEPRSVAASPAADTVKITVNRLIVTGARVYSEAELLALTGFEPGSTLTLTELRGMAAKIADHYHRNGYFVAQAYLPAQDIENGAVTIAVIEGHYGKVILQNQSSLSDDVANRILNGLNSGDIIASAPLESRLLLLSDLPGVSVKSTLVPGTAPGTSDLIVELHPGKTISGSIDADNAGSRYTGEYRVGATVNLNNLAGLGDVASLRVLTSGSGLTYARISYQVPFGRAVAGVAYSYLTYSLGREFEYLDANGTAEVATLYGGYALIRSRNTNLSAHLALDAKTFQDRIDAFSSVTDKKVNALTASLIGDHRDSFAGGGLSAYSLAWTTGNLDIETPDARAYDAATAQTNGHYNKLGFSAMRLQNVTHLVSLYGAVSGQFASKNLDVSEKMSMGGMYGVRAYPVGEASADEGYLMTLEARLLLPKYSQQMSGQMHLIAFADSGTVRINKDPWDSSLDNRRTLSGAGLGLSWIDPGNFAVRTYYARKIGDEPATSAPDKSGRFWIQAVKYF